MTRRALSDDDLDRAAELIVGGMSLLATAGQFGVQEATLRRWLTKRGTPPAELRRQRPQRPPRPPVPRAPRPHRLTAEVASIPMRLPVEHLRALRAFATARGASMTDVIRTALWHVGVTDPERAALVELDLPRWPTRTRGPNRNDRAAARRDHLRAIIGERGLPIGEAGVLVLAAELGVTSRTLYRDLDLVSRDPRAPGG